MGNSHKCDYTEYVVRPISGEQSKSVCDQDATNYWLGDMEDGIPWANAFCPNHNPAKGRRLVFPQDSHEVTLEEYENRISVRHIMES